jgi:hypothetical protein
MGKELAKTETVLLRRCVRPESSSERSRQLMCAGDNLAYREYISRSDPLKLVKAVSVPFSHDRLRRERAGRY